MLSLLLRQKKDSLKGKNNDSESIKINPMMYNDSLCYESGEGHVSRDKIDSHDPSH